MKSKELRIGNFIYHYKEIVEITEITKDSVEYKPIDDSIGGFVADCKPIPLTGDWLVKLGFKKHKVILGGTYNYILDEIAINSGIPTLVLYGNEDGYANIHPIKYVHQIQNLYFALTGKELKFKS